MPSLDQLPWVLRKRIENTLFWIRRVLQNKKNLKKTIFEKSSKNSFIGSQSWKWSKSVIEPILAFCDAWTFVNTLLCRQKDVIRDESSIALYSCLHCLHCCPRVTFIAGLPPRMTSFWIISSQTSLNLLKFLHISSNFLSNSPFSPSLAALHCPYCFKY